MKGPRTQYQIFQHLTTCMIGIRCGLTSGGFIYIESSVSNLAFVIDFFRQIVQILIMLLKTLCAILCFNKPFLIFLLMLLCIMSYVLDG